MKDNSDEFNFLLSSMSPEVNKNVKKTSSKKISKLALKKSLRRSSVYDKLAHIPQNDVTVSVSDTTESASVDSAKFPKCIDTPTHGKDDFALLGTELRTETPTKSLKSKDIIKWVAEVNANKNYLYDCNTDIDSCNVSVFSEISTICLDENRANPKIPVTSTDIAANSTFLDNKNGFRFDEMFHKKTRLNDVDKTENNDIQILKKYETRTASTTNNISESVVIIDESIITEDECLETPTKTAYQIEEHEKILDELYGHSWRLNKEKVLTPSESNDLKKLNVKKNKIYPKSEIKPKPSITHKNPYLFNEIGKSNNLLRTLQTEKVQRTVSSLMNRLKYLCDSESSVESLGSELRKNCKTKLNFDDSCSDEENNDFLKNDDKENFFLKNNDIGSFEKNINKSDSSENSSEINTLKNKVSNLYKQKDKNLGEHETSSKRRIIVDKKVTILDENITKKPNKAGKSNSKKKESLKKLKELNNSDDNLDMLGQKEYISADKTGTGNVQSNIIKTDSNSHIVEDCVKSLLKTATTRKGISHNEEEATESFLKSLSNRIPSDRCHPSAKIYRNTYKTSKTELAKKLFDLYNENIFENNIPSDTPIEWNDRMRGTAGFCYCRKVTRGTGAVHRTVRIALATKVLDSADRLRDTLVHEMCHAATWIVNEVSDGHGLFWKSWADKAMKTFPELPLIKRCHDYQINTKYTYRCSECSYSIGRHSKSLDIERKRCGYCYGKFEIFINKVTKSGVQSLTPVTPKKEATGFALYVKENYGSTKKANMKHADVMKSLSKQFNELKTK